MITHLPPSSGGTANKDLIVGFLAQVFDTPPDSHLFPDFSDMAPDWLISVADSDTEKMKAKIEKKADGEIRGKRQRPSRHIRARARLPTSGPDKEKYQLPEWVTEECFKDLMQMMLKSIANLQQRMRIMEAVVADNYVVPSKLKAVAAGITQAEAYHKQALTDKTKMGAPGPQVLYAFCAALLKLDIGEGAKVVLQRDIIDRFGSLTQDTASEVVAVFNIRVCYDTEYHKIVLVSQDTTVRAAFKKSITALADVKHYTAPAPATGQEDEIQKWIEKLESLDMA